jgi:hypothetical protein
MIQRSSCPELALIYTSWSEYKWEQSKYSSNVTQDKSSEIGMPLCRQQAKTIVELYTSGLISNYVPQRYEEEQNSLLVHMPTEQKRSIPAQG